MPARNGQRAVHQHPAPASAGQERGLFAGPAKPAGGRVAISPLPNFQFRVPDEDSQLLSMNG